MLSVGITVHLYNKTRPGLYTYDTHTLGLSSMPKYGLRSCAESFVPSGTPTQFCGVEDFDSFNLSYLSSQSTTPIALNITTPTASLSSDSSCMSYSLPSINSPSDCPFSSPCGDIENGEDSLHDNPDPFKLLKKIRVSNINRLVIGQLNINSIRNKFEALKSIVRGNLDILIVTESKLAQRANFLWKATHPHCA